MTLDHPVIGPVTISPMFERELPLILDSWMRSSHWRRSAIVAAVETGPVTVARDEGGLALAWLAMSYGKVVHAFCKSAYRDLGLIRALWTAAGKPQEAVADPGNRRVRSVLAHLIEKETT